MLIAPAPGEALNTQEPFFQWTPVVVPPAYPVQYVLQVAEVLANQTAEEALNAGIPHYQQPDLDVTNLQYPPNGQPFEPGKAIRVARGRDGCQRFSANGEWRPE